MYRQTQVEFIYLIKLLISKEMNYFSFKSIFELPCFMDKMIESNLKP